MDLTELLNWIARYDQWVYALLLAYCLGKTGPLPMLAWTRHVLIDSVGAFLWIFTMIGVGWSFGQIGAALDPRWAAYVGLTLLVLSAIALALLGKRLKARLLPLAEKILQERTAMKNSRTIA
jgi:membrane protein DedA with SNARE-associated domain